MPTCDVCGAFPAVEQRRVLHQPNRAWYCQRCLDVGAEPWEILAWYRALLAFMASDVPGSTVLQQSIERADQAAARTCRRLGRTAAEFDAAVAWWAKNPGAALCAIHGFEPVPANPYLVCYECHHAFATEAELIGEHRRVLVSLGLPVEAAISGRDVDVCPLCTHSF